VLARQAAAAVGVGTCWPWETAATLPSVRRRKALRRPRGRRGAGHIVATARPQLADCELQALDLTINSTKSYCLRIGPRCDVNCSIITNVTGVMITWVSELRYLGVILVKSRSFKVCLDYARRSFYRAANAIFVKIGRLASEEVILQLIVSKCMPVLLYGLEACTLNKSQLSSLDFCYKTLNIFFMKQFQTNSIEIVRACQRSFGLGFEVPSVLLKKRTEN